MALRVLVGAASVAVIVVSAVWLFQQFSPAFDDMRRERERAAWAASPEGECARLFQAEADYRRTGNVTALPMKFAEFNLRLQECRGATAQ